jgi:hypothetical protein
MNIHTGKFSKPEEHHEGWSKVLRFTGSTEIWLGKRWILIDWL